MFRRARGRGCRRDDHRRCSWARRLLPLPRVLGGGVGREAEPRGRLVPLLQGRAARRHRSAAFAKVVRPRRNLPAGLHTLLPALAQRAHLSTSCEPPFRCWDRSWVGAPPTTSGPTSSPNSSSRSARWCRPSWPAPIASVRALEPVEPRADLGFVANYLYMLTGGPTAAHARAIEQYMVLTIDHGFTRRPSPHAWSPRRAPTSPQRSSPPRRVVGSVARRRTQPSPRHARRHRVAGPSRHLCAERY